MVAMMIAAVNVAFAITKMKGAKPKP